MSQKTYQMEQQFINKQNVLNLKIIIMKKIVKIFYLVVIFIFQFSCAQIKIKKVQDARKIENVKQMYIGKPLKYFLGHLKMPIKSVIPAPNKKIKEINRISFLFVSHDEYRNNRRNVSEKPTRITVEFNQNWNLEGDRCRYDIKGCTEWTKEDEQNLGDLIVYDIYVLGKD